MSGFDLENVGEVTAKSNLEIEMRLDLSVIGQIEILMHAAIDVPIERQAHGVWRDRPLFCHQAAIGETNSRGEDVVVPLLRRSHGSPLARMVQLLIEAGIEKVEALGARPFYLAIRFADEHRVPLMDREVRRTDFDFQRHPRLPQLAERSSAFSSLSRPA